MNTYYYRNYITTVECGTISAAARKLWIAQPALSSQIKTLEKYYGTDLFIRNSRSLQLTESGKLLYAAAKRIVALENTVQREITNCTNTTRGTLMIGLSNRVLEPSLSKMFLDFHKQFPEITIVTCERASEAVASCIINGTVELAILYEHSNYLPSPTPIDTALTMHGELMVVYHQDNPWLTVSEGPIELNALKDIPLCATSDFQLFIEKACEKYNFHPTWACLSSSIFSQAFLDSGNYISIMPVYHPKIFMEKGYCCRKISDTSFRIKKSIYYIKERELSKQAKIFLEFASQYFCY